MAKLNTLAIADRNSTYDSGGAFLLAQDPREDLFLSPNKHSEIEIKKKNPYVVVRMRGTQNFTDAYNTAYEVSQKGLDLMSVSGKADLSVINATDECLIWWQHKSKQILRIVFTDVLNVATQATLTVTDKYGNVKSSPSPPIVYDKCFRYYRLSQTADDVFESFRNMYLAFELVLSSKYKKVGGERQWLQSSLKKAHQSINLTSAFKPKGPDLITEIMDDIYEDIRCRLFHAGANKPKLLPHNQQDRIIVMEGLSKLTQLFQLLASHWFKMNRGGGGLTYAGFDLMLKGMESHPVIHVSDSNAKIKQSESLADSYYKNAVPIKAKLDSKLSEPGIKIFLAGTSIKNVMRLKNIRRFGLESNNTLFTVNKLRARLSFENIDRLETQIGLRLVNRSQPKYFFRS